MIVNCDAKALEWVCSTYLSQDKVALVELNNGLDIHSNNMKDLNIPTRLSAKVFLFRTIYANLEYAAFTFANDPEFRDVSTSQRFWQSVIDRFVSKYAGFIQWHNHLVQEVSRTGKLVMPTGREYSFTRNDYKGWPITEIYNYPVQGLGADIMAIIRIMFFRRFKNDPTIYNNAIIVNSVHDSISVDCKQGMEERITQLFNDVFDDFPDTWYRLFGTRFNTSLRCEVSVGPNMKELVSV